MAKNTTLQRDKTFCGIIRDNRGQGLVEYALILVLIAVAVIAALGTLGNGTNNTFNSVNTELSK